MNETIKYLRKQIQYFKDLGMGPKNEIRIKLQMRLNILEEVYKLLNDFFDNNVEVYRADEDDVMDNGEYMFKENDWEDLLSEIKG